MNLSTGSVSFKKSIFAAVFVLVFFFQEKALAVWGFPSFGNNTVNTNTTQTTQTSNSFLDKVLQNIGFGNRILTPQAQQIKPAAQSTANTNLQQTTKIETFDPNTGSIIQIEVPRVEVPNFAAPFSSATPTTKTGTNTVKPVVNITNFGVQGTVASPNTNLITNTSVKSDLEKSICDALIKKGVQFKEGTPCQGGIIAKPTTNTNQTAQSCGNGATNYPTCNSFINGQNTNQNSSQQDQQINKNLQSLYGQNPQNSYNQGGYTFSACEYASNKAQCNREMQISCNQSYLSGAYFIPECATQPSSIYGQSSFGSQPFYGMNNYINDPRTAQMQAFLLGNKGYSGPSGVLGGNNYSTFDGSSMTITGAATQYGCMNNRPDNFLISTYRYISAFGKKVRYGTNVGDSTDSCNFNYCGVAVPLPFIQKTYGGKAAAKDQPVKIVNKGNLKCVIAPIQDISSVKTWTHKGSNAVMDLSQCAMQALGGGGKIWVDFVPVKKGETTEGCVVLK